MNDVELKRALARVEIPDKKGGPREVPVSGRLAPARASGSRSARSTT